MIQTLDQIIQIRKAHQTDELLGSMLNELSENISEMNLLNPQGKSPYQIANHDISERVEKLEDMIFKRGTTIWNYIGEKDQQKRDQTKETRGRKLEAIVILLTLVSAIGTASSAVTSFLDRQDRITKEVNQQLEDLLKFKIQEAIEAQKLLKESEHPPDEISK